MDIDPGKALLRRFANGWNTMIHHATDTGQQRRDVRPQRTVGEGG
jgi:hypothetical protein